MKLFALFIERPVTSTLLSVAITLCGILTFMLLPIAPLPQVDFPVIKVSASLPGASPETMASSVATPLERALGQIAGINEMTSNSSLGNTNIMLEFDLDKDINSAAREVQAALNAAQSMLPTGMPSRPRYYKTNPADAPIIILTLTSNSYPIGEIYDIASTRLAQRLAQIAGVSEVSVSGGSLPAVRIELNPTALFNQGIALDAVREAVNNANVRRPQGYLHDEQFRWQIKTNDELKSAADYQPIIIHSHNNSVVRLQDVANIKDSVQDIRTAGMAAGQPAIILVIRREAGANIIATVDRIRAELPELRKMLPASINLTIAQDRTPTIRASLTEVERALSIAIGLVILVVFLFLRSGRATIIPAIVVPVSLIGSFSAMYLCGFSLNNLSLMALTVATGFVVDDAIVVIENIMRHIENGLAPHKAAIIGVSEVGFTVLSMSISLIAVFIPLFFMGGLVGRFFHEFAITLATAILISLFVSLSLTPMMCAYLLKKTKKHSPHKISGVGRLLLKIQQSYGVTLNWVLAHQRNVLLVLLATIGLNIYLYISIPKTFFPEQDTGRLLGYVRADQSISFQAMKTKMTQFMIQLAKDPSIDNVTGFTGGSRINSGFMFISLKPQNLRKETANQVIQRLRTQLANEPGANLFLIPVQDIRAGGRQATANYQFTLLADDLNELRQWEPQVRKALAELPQLADVNSDKEDKGSEMAITYDRDKMAQLGINVKDANNLLNDAFGQRQISTIYQPMNQYKVVMELAPEYTQDASSLAKMFVINKYGKAIPLSFFAKWQPTNAPLSVNHQGLSASSTISFNLNEGYTLNDAIEAIELTMIQLSVPPTVRSTFSGTAKIFQETLKTQLFLIIAAIGAVYLVLGILYESYIHPLTIISTLPSAGLGALLALELFNTPFSLIALIGIMLLIGIVKKNAIIMVDFAIQAQRQGQLSAHDAIFKASLLRFRPILMTTIAAIFGMLPLALGNGDGAELRQPLGITIVGGLIVSQVLTLYTTPVVYLAFDKLQGYLQQKRQLARLE
ncbi:multidrug efflux RND transporter permease subunit MdtC [Arsenophonus sp. aPb]|uniref:multidrug efflux RND transporter permease subunit MdtC n=1 Tax=Arsenophonus sp. aPb TaxID=3041619 RepID=UPI0024686F4E|nr:multidrug efflux RND transporter permease subunit MdtC [Arsenophonus sp. aPb]WGL97166.1 multidrug efflux RND transporter permease subunit MdtC [Arsenophonus sp. aPb]